MTAIRARWVSISDVTDIVLQRSNKVAERLKALDRRHQLQYVRRLVARAERRDDERFTKRVSGDIFVRLDAVEALLPVDAATVTRLELSVNAMGADNRNLWRHIGGHGSQLRDVRKRLKKVERKQELFARFQAELQAIDSDG